MTKKSLLEAYPKRYDIVLLLMASAGFLAAGLTLPVLTVRQIFAKNTFTIFTGIQNLWITDRQYFLAAVVFFFSVIFPIAKLGALYTIWFCRMRSEDRQRILHWLAALGKWSMLDVFVVAVIIVTVKLGVLASATAEKGIYYFGSSVLIAMVATALETRLAKRGS